ncbi:MAG: hypothetical protein H6667_17535 [Ardenticatenaceae bacterium]|nr:hypothetical protein [Ardenticatenaceae bacterium]MCB9443257.1 hypothetical protein [Ardenticatenaceae bacterium]
MTKQLTLQQLHTAVHAALRAWGDLAGADLLTNLQIVQQERARAASDSPTVHRLTTNQVLLEGIQILQKQDPVEAKILSMRFMDDETVLIVANRLNLSEDQIKRRQRDAIHHLTQILWEQETAVRQQQAHTLEAQLLPASYDQLFGVRERLDELGQYLFDPDGPGVIALVGIGGIGKTSLADAAVRQAIAQFAYQEIVWLRVNPDDVGPDHDPGFTADQVLTGLAEKLCPHAAPQNRSTGLRQALKTMPTLVVIDNLESAADTAFMLEMLQDLAIPSKFLLTTRVRLPAAASVHNIFLDELSAAAAADLVRHQAKLINLPDLTQAPEALIAQIYAVTGGNPLAIKLVVGLTAVLPLPQILADLTAAQTSEIEAMYRHIYWQAWHSLSENAQILLEMMPMAAGTGVKPEQMLAMSDLSPNQLWPAVAELVNRSLLEARGTAWERRYGIHRLTESFLRTEIIHWPDSP